MFFAIHSTNPNFYKIPQALRHSQCQQRFVNDLFPNNQYFPFPFHTNSASHPSLSNEERRQDNNNSPIDPSFLIEAYEREESESFSKSAEIRDLFNDSCKDRKLVQNRVHFLKNFGRENPEDRHQIQKSDLNKSPISPSQTFSTEKSTEYFQNFPVNQIHFCEEEKRLVDLCRTPKSNENAEKDISSQINPSNSQPQFARVLNKEIVNRDRSPISTISNEINSDVEKRSQFDYEKFFDDIVQKTSEMQPIPNLSKCLIMELKVQNWNAKAIIHPNSAINFINPEFLFKLSVNEKVDLLKWGFQPKSDLTGLPYQFATYKGQPIPVYGLINVPIDIGNSEFETWCMVAKTPLEYDFILSGNVLNLLENLKRDEDQANNGHANSQNLQTFPKFSAPLKAQPGQGKKFGQSTPKMLRQCPMISSPFPQNFRKKNKPKITNQHPFPQFSNYQKKSLHSYPTQFCTKNPPVKPRIFLNSKFKESKTEKKGFLQKFRPPSLLSIQTHIPQAFLPISNMSSKYNWTISKFARHPLPVSPNFYFSNSLMSPQCRRCPTTTSARRPPWFVAEGGQTPERFAGAQLVGAR